MLAARLFGGEVEVAVGLLPGRVFLSLSMAHDFGAGEARSPPVTLAHADVSAALFRREDLEVHLLGGVGTRARMPGLPWGALAGLAVEARSDTLELGGRLEARLQRGGFRQGFFGPDYELSRLRAVGGSEVPLARASFPEGHSAFGELVVGWDWLHLDHARRQLQLSVATEVFSSGSGSVPSMRAECPGQAPRPVDSRSGGCEEGPCSAPSFCLPWGSSRCCLPPPKPPSRSLPPPRCTRSSSASGGTSWSAARRTRPWRATAAGMTAGTT